MRAFYLTRPATYRRRASRSPRRKLAALQPYVPVLRLLVLVVLAFALAYYLDTRRAAEGETPATAGLAASEGTAPPTARLLR